MENKEYYQNLFAKNLQHYMNVSGKKQINFIQDLNLNRASVSSWCTGTRIPRMDKIDMFAQYLGIERSDLIDGSEVTNNKKEDTISLTAEEEQLLAFYRKLNSTGKSRLLESAANLSEIEKYKK